MHQWSCRMQLMLYFEPDSVLYIFRNCDTPNSNPVKKKEKTKKKNKILRLINLSFL